MGVQKKMVKTPPDKSKKSAVKGVKLAKKASPDMKGNKKVTPTSSGKARGGGLGGSVNNSGGGGGASVPPLSTSPSNVVGADVASVSGAGSDVSRGAAGGGPKKSKKSRPSSPIKPKAAAKKSIEGVAGGSSKSNAAASVGKSVKKGRKSPANSSGSGSIKSPSKTKKSGVSVLVQKKSVKSPSSGGKKSGPTPAKSPKTKSASGTKRKSSPKTSVAKRSSPGKGANKKVATSKKPAASGRKTPLVEDEEPSENEDEANESEEETTKRKSPPKKKQGGSGSKRGQTKKKANPSVSSNPPGKAKSVRNATNLSDHGEINSSSGDEVSSAEEEEENEPAKSSRKSRVAIAPKSKIPTRLTAKSSMKAVKKAGGGRKSNVVADASSIPTSEEEEEEDNDNGDTDDEEDNVRSRSSQRQTPKKSRVPKVNSKVARTSKKMPVKSRVNDSSSEDQSSSNSEDENSKAKNGKPKGNKNSSQVSAHKMRKFQKRSPLKGKNPVSSSEVEDDSSEDELDKRNPKKGNKGREKVIAKKTAAKLKSTMKKTKPVSKALMAKKKLKQMQSLGFWGAPPRRAASLNAAAVMHCMYDQDLPSSKGGSMAKNAAKLKKNESPMTSKDSKDPKPSKPQPRRSATAKMREAKEGDEDADEDEQDPDQNEEGEVSGGQNESDAEKSPKTKKAKKLVKKPPPKSRLAPKKQRSVSETEEDGEEEEDEEEEREAKAAKTKRQVEKKFKFPKTKSKPSTSSKKKPPQLKSLKRSRTPLEQDGSNDENQLSDGSDTDSDAKKETSQSFKHQKKKKTLKDEFKMDIRDMIVKKRIASLNASAIMSASYSQLKSPPLNPIKALALKTDQAKPIVTVPSTQRGSKKLGPKQGEKASKTGKKSAAILTAMSSPTLKKRKISSSLPPDEQQPIIFEIEDERIKSLLIASAMKKAGNNSGLLGKDEKSQKLPPKKRKLEKCALTPISGSGAQKKKLQSGFLKNDESLKGKKRKKKRKKNINVDLSSSSSSSGDDSASDVTSGESDIESKRIEVVDNDDDDDEIETIFTEGARSEGIVSRIPGAAQAVLPSAENPMALKTEMNKVDVQIMDSGRVIHHHQVVHHRFETISTTTSMVPRSGSRGNQSVQQDDGSTVPGNGKYTPLGALASLQPGNGHPASAPSQAGVTPGPPAPAPRFPSTYQGFYQPAGPLIRPGSPTSNVVPPTATVQPTVVSCAASGSGGNHRSTSGHPSTSGSSRDSEFPSNQKNVPSTSPVKPTPHQAPAGVPPAAMTAPPYPPTYPYPYPTEYLPTGYVAPPPPHHMPYHPGGTQLPGGPPPPPQAPLHYAPYHPAEFRHPYPLYHHANTAATAQGYPPQGPYYLAPALPYHPSALASTTSPSSSTSGTQVALSAPHPAGTFYYGGYSAAAYPYTAAGRIVTPILALAPPGHQPPPPHSAVPPGFPTQHHQAQTSIYSYSVQHDPKNVQAGSQPVGKGLSSQPPPPPTFATTPTTATTIVVSAGVNTKSVSSANSKKALKSVSAPSSKDLRPTLKVPTPKSHSALPSQVVPNEVYRSILPRQPLPPNKGPPGYSKSKSSSSHRARSPPEVAVVAASKAKVSNVKPCNPPNPPQPFVVGQTTIHPVDPNAIRKPPKPVVAESQMATITPKMVPVVSTVASRMSSSTGKSSLRDYRKPAKSKHQASSSVASVTQEQSSSTLPSGLKYIPPLPVTNQSGGKYGNPPPPTTIYQHLPKGLTITEIDRSRSLSSKLSAKGSKITTVPSNSETLTATTSQIPTTSLTSSSPSISSPSSSCTSLLATPPNNGHRLHLMPVINIPDPHKNRRPPPTSTGHPGLPNGLLRMAHTSLQQQSQPPPPKIATKVVPKDLKSQLALSKIALSMASGSSSQDQSPTTGYQASTPCSTSTSSTSVSKNGQPPPPPSISVSMAKSAAMALHPHQPPVPKLMPKKSKSTFLKAPKVNNNKPSLLPSGARSTSSLKASSRMGTGSPGSSRSSSRNSSLSPRERSGSNSKGSSTVPFLGVGGGKSVMSSSSSSSGSSNSSGGCGGGGGSGKVPLSPLSRGQSSMSKKKATINQIQGPLIPWSKRHNGVLKSCNGWQWVGDGTEQKVYLNNEEPPVPRICYDSMKHCTEGDVVKIRDCILLASGNRKKDLPFIAKVTALWENPTDGDMMMSLLWYYRPEHLESGRRSDDMSDEVYASRHRDNTSVACIEDKCYVMTFNEYCRYRKFLRMVDQGLSSGTSIVPDPVPGYERAEFLPTQRVAPDRVFLCRRVYESRQRRLLKNPY